MVLVKTPIRNPNGHNKKANFNNKQAKQPIHLFFIFYFSFVLFCFFFVFVFFIILLSMKGERTITTNYFLNKLIVLLGS